MVSGEEDMVRTADTVQQASLTMGKSQSKHRAGQLGERVLELSYKCAVSDVTTAAHPGVNWTCSMCANNVASGPTMSKKAPSRRLRRP